MKLSEWRASSALPVREADLLIEHVCGLDKIHIVTEAASFVLSPEMLEALDRFQFRRLLGEPLQYLLGWAYFMGRRFLVCPDVLIPRPDTEILVAEAVRCFREAYPAGGRILDLCTGSGCIGISILLELEKQDAAMTMTDVSAQALAAAQKNYRRLLNKEGAAAFIKSDFFAGLRGMRFDMIVSNPPYIKDAVIDTLAPEVRDYEPRIALSGGIDGLEAYRVIARDVKSFLRENGHLLLEVGYDQADEVRRLFAPLFTHADIKKDLNGFGRVLHMYNL